MKNNFLKIITISILSIALILNLSNNVSAETAKFEPKQPTQVQLDKITTECVNIKKQLAKVHSTDALKRVKLGQIYESTSKDLMAKFTARAILNHFSVTNLVSQTAKFDENINYFKDNYRIYEQELDKLQKLDCIKSENGVNFYTQLEKVRYQRRELNYNVSKLREIAEEYKKEFIELKKGVK